METGRKRDGKWKNKYNCRYSDLQLWSIKSGTEWTDDHETKPAYLADHVHK